MKIIFYTCSLHFTFTVKPITILSHCSNQLQLTLLFILTDMSLKWAFSDTWYDWRASILPWLPGLHSLAFPLTSPTSLSLHCELCFLYTDLRCWYYPEFQPLPFLNMNSFLFFKMPTKHHLLCKDCSLSTLFLQKGKEGQPLLPSA